MPQSPVLNNYLVQRQKKKNAQESSKIQKHILEESFAFAINTEI